MTIGVRPIQSIDHFSPIKKWLQRFGSKVVRLVSGTDVQDAPCGFRAYSRECALRLNVFNNYTYTLETLIQCGQNRLSIISVPIAVNSKTRSSRLMKNTLDYVIRSAFTIFRIFIVYQPLKFFMCLSSIPLTLGTILCIRWIIIFLQGSSRAHVPSLVLASMLLISGLGLWIIGIVGDLLATNRKTLEEIQYAIRKERLFEKKDSSNKGYNVQSRKFNESQEICN